MSTLETALKYLIELYGDETGRATFERLRLLIDHYRLSASSAVFRERGKVSQADAILITYGDQVQEPGILPLRSLTEFCQHHLIGIVNAIHILPFFPFTSDDGFSVVDYKAIDPELGTWEDIAALGKHFRLMFDAVINHISAQSRWFQAYLQGDPEYNDYFTVIEGNPDLSQVVRPRALPLLTRFTTPAGDKAVWTTFSTDQIDLNYHNPDVLLNIIDVLLHYAAQGAEFIRLDAIAYLWKEVGSSCIHLPQTHQIIQLFRIVLDEVAPQVLLITETNVPHADNISYFGDGTNEAQLVYNFALPPLVLHTLRTGNTRSLSDWAHSLKLPSNKVTFFNFLASHDGIGLNPVRGILGEQEIDALVEMALAHGGLISYKSNPDGTQSPYELNINYFDALSGVETEEKDEICIDRFIVSQAIMLALSGVPGIYFHSLFGSRGWKEGLKLTGHNRSINRKKFNRCDLERKLQDPASQPSQIYNRYAQLLKSRAGSPAFHPNGKQVVLDCGEAIFALSRTSPNEKEYVLCLNNVSNQSHKVSLAGMIPEPCFTQGYNLITKQPVIWEKEKVLNLEPYQVIWIGWEI
jgi:sucrose phosphorylase